MPSPKAATPSDQCKATLFIPAPLLNPFRLPCAVLQLESLLTLEEQNQIAYPEKPAIV